MTVVLDRVRQFCIVFLESLKFDGKLFLLGEIINEKDKCKKCNGRKTTQEQKIIEVKISPGMRNMQKIIFYDEGDQEV